MGARHPSESSLSAAFLCNPEGTFRADPAPASPPWHSLCLCPPPSPPVSGFSRDRQGPFKRGSWARGSTGPALGWGAGEVQAPGLAQLSGGACCGVSAPRRDPQDPWHEGVCTPSLVGLPGHRDTLHRTQRLSAFPLRVLLQPKQAPRSAHELH